MRKCCASSGYNLFKLLLFPPETTVGLQSTTVLIVECDCLNYMGCKYMR